MMNTTAKPELLESKGRKNTKEIFDIRLSGQQVYDLLQLLESRALKPKCFLDLRQAVTFWDLVHDQAHEQGF